MKKICILTLLLLMTMGINTWADNVCKIGDVEYTTLEDAVTAAETGQTVEIVMAGTYSIPTINKDITIKGTVDNVNFNCEGSGSIASIPNGSTFEHVTMDFGQSAYHGFQHAGHITMTDCTLNGLFYSYGKMDFISCIFNQNEGEYNMWVYAGHVTYDRCTFNSQGKFLNVFNEGNDGGTPWKVVAKNCVFNTTKANKAALNIKETCGNTFLRYDVTIDNCTCNEIQSSLKNEIDGTLYRISPIWQVDDIKAGNAHINVTVDGKKLFPIPVSVAKIGETTYATLAEAIAAVGDGETITMIADVEKAAGISVPSGKNFTVDFQNHKYAVECPGAGSASTKTQAFQLLQGSTIVFKNGTIACTEANKEKTWTSTSESKGIAMIIQNYANLTLDGMTIDGTNIAHNGNNARYAVSNNCGTVEFKGATTINAPVAGDFAFDVCKNASYDAPTVTWNSTGNVNGFIELSGGNFVLGHDLEVKQPIKVIAPATLDLGDCTLSAASDFTKKKRGVVIVNRGGDLTINGTTGVIDGSTNKVYAAVAMTEAEDTGDNAAKLTVNGGTLQGLYYGIVGNGQRQNTEITVNGGTVKGTEMNDCVGIYHPQSGTLNINGGNIEGATGLVLKGGKLSVKGGTIKGNGSAGDFNHNGSGWNNTGDALAIEVCDYPGQPLSVEIVDGAFASANGKAVASYVQPNRGYTPLTNFIKGGIYSKTPVAEYLAIGKTVISNPDEATKGDYPYAVLPTADEVQVAPDLEIAPAEGEQPLTDEEKEKAKTKVDNAITDMRGNESAILPDDIKQSNKKAVEESVLTTDQSVGVNVEFDGVKVKVETASVTLKEFTFDVTPYVVETVTVGEEQKSVSVKKIENENIKAPMTFRLPIPSDVADNCARVIHHKENGEDEDMGLYSITINDTGRYIEISTTSFSRFEAVLKNINAPTNLYYYAGNSTKVETNDPNEFINKKTTQPNAIAFVESQYADWAAENVNVVVDYTVGTNGHYYECPEFLLTDKKDFYTPVDFVALKGLYTRENTYGINSVCLPFEITNDDVRNGSIGVFHSTDMYDGQTYKTSGNIYLRYANTVAGGTPCIVQCNTIDPWFIDLTGKPIVSAIDNTHAFMGSYIGQVIGTGYFKVSEDGSKFVNTNAESKVCPFRSYLSLSDVQPMEAEGGSNAKELNITWVDDNDVTGIEEVKTNTNNNAKGMIYDLSGRMITSPVKGGLYIINGKKVIFK